MATTWDELWKWYLWQRGHTQEFLTDPRAEARDWHTLSRAFEKNNYLAMAEKCFSIAMGLESLK